MKWSADEFIVIQVDKSDLFISAIVLIGAPVLLQIVVITVFFLAWRRWRVKPVAKEWLTAQCPRD